MGAGQRFRMKHERNWWGSALTIREQLEPPLRAAGVKPTCAAAGVPYPTVFRWLRGGCSLSDRHIEALAGVLGLKIRVSRKG